jgi:hypothetical protein
LKAHHTYFFTEIYYFCHHELFDLSHWEFPFIIAAFADWYYGIGGFFGIVVVSATIH